MTDLDHVRAIAMLLPEAAEHEVEGEVRFTVDGRLFARLTNHALDVRTGDQDDAWSLTVLTDDSDWAWVEDRIALSWELTAPRRLLEAGGR